MKVSQVLYSGLGGHGSVAFSLLKADTSSQWSPVLIFFGVEDVLSAYLAICKSKAIPNSYINVLPGYPWLSWKSLWKFLRSHKPDVVILHSIKTIIPCWFYCLVHKIPLIAVEHQPNQLKTPFEWLVSILALWLAKYVVFLTPQYQEEIQKSLGIL